MKRRDRCYRAGFKAGVNAAAWWEQDAIGGRSSSPEETADAVLTGLENGDPEVLDSLPTLDLSGQWADGPTDADVLSDCGYADPERMLEREPEACSERIEAYREGYDAGVRHEVYRKCRATLVEA